MPTHLYCLLPAGSNVAPPASPPVRLLMAGDCLAWVADVASPRLSRDARDATRAAIEHDRVVGSALVQGVTPLPSVLADPYESDDAARDDILRHAAGISRALASIDGMVEMTTIVAVVDAAPPTSTEGRGRAYLEQLRSLPSRAASIADRIARQLTDVGGQARRRAEGGRVGLSHLVTRGRADAYRTAARKCDGEGYRVVIDGPRAPYSFASFVPRRGVGPFPSG